MQIDKTKVQASDLCSFAEYKERQGFGKTLTHQQYLADLASDVKYYDVPVKPWDGVKFCATIPNQTLSYQCQTGGLDWVKLGNDRFIVWNEKAEAWQPQQYTRTPAVAGGNRSVMTFGDTVGTVV